MPKSRKKPLASHPNRAAGYDPEILQGMAHGVWSDYWASEQEEAGESFSGMNLYEISPETPTWAKKWAKKLASSIEHLNGNRTLDLLFQAARNAGFPRDREAFGYYLGMQAVGHGVHWTDDVSTGPDTPKILVPSYEFYQGAERSEPDTRFVHP